MKISIVMPLGPDEALPVKLIAQLSAQPAQADLILSVAEGSELKEPAGARMLVGPIGRAGQQNRAAAAACGDWLWFVHADSLLPDDALDRALVFVERHKAVLGYSRLRFAADGPGLTRLNAIGANLRSRWLGLPYGDQGLCLPRASFMAIGGFRGHLARGEDLDFVVRARRTGLKPRPMDITMTTSSRRYREQGWLRTTLRHQIAAIRLIRQAR